MARPDLVVRCSLGVEDGFGISAPCLLAVGVSV